MAEVSYIKKKKTFSINEYRSIIFKFSYCSQTKCTKWFERCYSQNRKIRDEAIFSSEFLKTILAMNTLLRKISLHFPTPVNFLFARVLQLPIPNYR